MRHVLFAALFVVGLDGAVAATPGPNPVAPQIPHAEPRQPACTDNRNSADYVPGVDAYGRAVAPADLPGSTADVRIDTQIYTELRTGNPQLRSAGVVANLPDLQTRAPCPAISAPQSAIKLH